MKPVVVHLINSLTSGGAEKILTDVLPLLNKSDFSVYLVILNSDKAFDYYLSILIENDVKIIDLRRNYFSPLVVIDLIRLTRALRVDVWHSHLFPSHYWLAIASLFLKRDVLILRTEHAFTNRRLENKFLIFIEKIVIRKFNYIIAISSGIQTVLIEKLSYPMSKVILIKNGINIAQVINCNLSSSNIFNHNYFNLLMVARFDLWQKDHKSLVLAMLRLDSNFRLYFAGIGPNQRNIKLLVKDLGLEDRIFFLDLREDVYNLMKLVDLNILITRFEGLSGVVLESLAAKKPFLGSNVSGVFDIVPDSRFLLLSNEPEVISSKIYTIYKSKDLQNSMSKEGFDFVQNFDTQIMVDKLVSFYNHILKK